jgi:hypothetical protein
MQQKKNPADAGEALKSEFLLRLGTVYPHQHEGGSILASARETPSETNAHNCLVLNDRIKLAFFQTTNKLRPTDDIIIELCCH